MSTEWTYEPVDIDKWEYSDCRILVVGAGGFQFNDDDFEESDLGTWFRTAVLTNDFHGNRSFFTRNLIQVMGAETRSSVSSDGQEFTRSIHSINTAPSSAFEAEFAHAFRNWVGAMRYLDLKPTLLKRIQEPSTMDWYDPTVATNTTNGRLVALHDEAVENFKANLDYYLSFWLSDPEENEDDLEPPTITIVQGAVAEKIFVEHVLPVLREKGLEGKWVVMPHPSVKVKLDTLWRAVQGLQSNLSDYGEAGNAWRAQNRKWVSL